MSSTIRTNRTDSRRSERMALYARIQVTTDDGKPTSPFAICTEIGLGGLRVSAEEGLPPGTRIQLAVRLPSEQIFESTGWVEWSRQTLHPTLFASPRGKVDAAEFGIVFDRRQPEELLPIARLFSARERERLRARRIRRRQDLPIDA